MNALAIVAFVLGMVIAVVRGRLAAKPQDREHGKARRWRSRAVAVFVAVFGTLTVKAGGSALFGGGAAGGNYVPFVIWFNFLAGFFYIAAAIGLWRERPWSAWLALWLAILTITVFAAFGTYVAAGGAFETRTVWAMTLRSVVWIAVAWFARRETASAWRQAP